LIDENELTQLELNDAKIRMEKYRKCLCPTCGQKILSPKELMEDSFVNALKFQIMDFLDKLRGD
jgi:hypothetical protein